MGDVMVDLQEALSEAAEALGEDRGKRNETIAQRITTIRKERDIARAEVERLREAGDEMASTLDALSAPGTPARMTADRWRNA